MVNRIQNGVITSVYPKKDQNLRARLYRLVHFKGLNIGQAMHDGENDKIISRSITFFSNRKPYFKLRDSERADSATSK